MTAQSCLRDFPIEMRGNVDDVIMQFHQAWNDRLDFPPTKILERYLRDDLALALNFCCEVDGHTAWITALVTHISLENFGWNLDGPRGHTQDEFSVFIDNVHVVNDQERRIDRVAGVIRLKAIDQVAHISTRDSLYFSFISGNAVFIDWPHFKNGKFDSAEMLSPVFRCGELPDHMIKTGTQMVDNLSREHGEPWWNHALLMVLNRLKEELVVVLGQDSVWAFLKKSVDFRLEITDILVGPF